MANQSALTDVQSLRQRARKHIEEGAVTAGYDADRNTVLKLLNDSLATEIVCVLRYRRLVSMFAPTPPYWRTISSTKKERLIFSRCSGRICSLKYPGKRIR